MMKKLEEIAFKLKQICTYCLKRNIPGGKERVSEAAVRGILLLLSPGELSSHL